MAMVRLEAGIARRLNHYWFRFEAGIARRFNVETAGSARSKRFEKTLSG